MRLTAKSAVETQGPLPLSEAACDGCSLKPYLFTYITQIKTKHSRGNRFIKIERVIVLLRQQGILYPDLQDRAAQADGFREVSCRLAELLDGKTAGSGSCPVCHAVLTLPSLAHFQLCRQEADRCASNLLAGSKYRKPTWVIRVVASASHLMKADWPSAVRW